VKLNSQRIDVESRKKRALDVKKTETKFAN